MKAMKVLLMLAVVSLVVFGAGCVGQGPQTSIGSQQEASQVVTDIGEGVGDISNVIEDVDTALG